MASQFAIKVELPLNQICFRICIVFYFLGYAHLVSGPYQKHSSTKNIFSAVFIDYADHFAFSAMYTAAPPLERKNQTLVGRFADCLRFNFGHSCTYFTKATLFRQVKPYRRVAFSISSLSAKYS